MKAGLLLLLLLGACDETPSVVGQGRERWLQTKVTCGQYHYTSKNDAFSGMRRQTSIEITDDKPTARVFFAANTFTGTVMLTESWTEVGPEVGTHSNGTGAKPARTMEELYEDCARDVLARDSKTNLINFQADERGALRVCTAVANGCADDCVKGDTVSDFGCGPLDLAPIRP
jgi:hypothetical protein